MPEKGEYDYPAWCKMETALGSYEQARDAYLEETARGLGPEAEQQLQQLRGAADTLMKGVEELAGVDPVQCLRDAVLSTSSDAGRTGQLDLLDEHVCIAFGWEAMGMLSVARERFWQLLGLIEPRDPSPKAREFLKRVSRCFLFGFDSECVVMCRAVLDREFEAEIPGDDVVTWWETTDKGKKGKPAPFNLWGRIQAACHTSRIGEDARASADQVRLDGNIAVHEKPSESNALVSIIRTVQALDALSQGSTKRERMDSGATGDE